MAFHKQLCTLTLVLTAAVPSQAYAVYVLDTVWTENGGSEDNLGEGFGPAKELAAEPEFDAVVGFWGSFEHDSHFGCSGTWLGNNENGNAIVLTAGHCMNDIDINDWSYRTALGEEHFGLQSWINPLYDRTDDSTNGYDLAILELEGPIEDIAEPAVLYSGSEELGYYVVTVGFGLRGPGDQADDRKFNTDNEKAAASNVIDVVDEVVEEQFEGQDPFLYGANLLQSDFDSPDCENSTVVGDECPVDEYEGMMAKGDSGGPGFIYTDYGVRLVGVNASSDVRYGYGMIGGHARISTQLDWVLSIFPDALVSE